MRQRKPQKTAVDPVRQTDKIGVTVLALSRALVGVYIKQYIVVIRFVER